MERKIVRRTIVLLFGVLLAMCLAEGSIRLFGPRVYQLHPIMTQSLPDESMRLLCYPSDPEAKFPLDLRDEETFARFAGLPGFEKLNELAEKTPHCIPQPANHDHVRDRDYPEVKPNGTIRILCVGDSMTHGYGVAEDAPWPRQLEVLLSRKYPDKRFEVMNYGRVGMEINNVYTHVKEFVPRYRPDLVVYGYCLNDVMRGDELEPGGNVDSALLRWLNRSPLPLGLEHFALARLFAERRYQRQVSLASSQWFDDLYSEKNKAGLRQTKFLLRWMAKRSEKAGTRFLLAVLPMMVPFGDEYPFLKAHRVMSAMAERLDMKVVDPLPVFTGLDPRDLWIHPIDHHPNRKG